MITIKINEDDHININGYDLAENKILDIEFLREKIAKLDEIMSLPGSDLIRDVGGDTFKRSLVPPLECVQYDEKIQAAIAEADRERAKERKQEQEAGRQLNVSLATWAAEFGSPEQKEALARGICDLEEISREITALAVPFGVDKVYFSSAAELSDQLPVVAGSEMAKIIAIEKMIESMPELTLEWKSIKGRGICALISFFDAIGRKYQYLYTIDSLYDYQSDLKNLKVR